MPDDPIRAPRPAGSARIPHRQRVHGRAWQSGEFPRSRGAPGTSVERCRRRWSASPGWSRALDASLALAVLTKGLIGIVFSGAIIFVHILATGNRQVLKRLQIGYGIIIFLIVAAPWHVAAALTNSDFLWFYFIREHLLRYLGMRYPKDYDTVPLLLFWGLHLVWLFPWSAFTWGLVRNFPRSIRPQEKTARSMPLSISLDRCNPGLLCVQYYPGILHAPHPCCVRAPVRQGHGGPGYPANLHEVGHCRPWGINGRDGFDSLGPDSARMGGETTDMPIPFPGPSPQLRSTSLLSITSKTSHPQLSAFWPHLSIGPPPS